MIHQREWRASIGRLALYWMYSLWMSSLVSLIKMLIGGSFLVAASVTRFSSFHFPLGRNLRKVGDELIDETLINEGSHLLSPSLLSSCFFSSSPTTTEVSTSESTTAGLSAATVLFSLLMLLLLMSLILSLSGFRSSSVSWQLRNSHITNSRAVSTVGSSLVDSSSSGSHHQHWVFRLFVGMYCMTHIGGLGEARNRGTNRGGDRQRQVAVLIWKAGWRG